MLISSPWILGHLALATAATAAVAATKQVAITVDASQKIAEWGVIDRFFGADEPNFAYYPHGQALLKEIGVLSPKQTYFRTHNMLTTGNGSTVGVPGLKWGSTDAYTLDAAGNPVYNFTIVDRIVDAYLAGSVKPYFELGFMPLALATDPDHYFFNFSATDPYSDIYTGWSHPPTSFAKWEELIYELASHLLEKYGEQELSTWYFEVWNEPNIPYWNGTTAQYYELWDRSVAAVRRAFPSAQIGGPAAAGGASGTYLGDFIDHTINGSNSATGGTGAPADFISFHAKGAPVFINTTDPGGGYIQMNVSTQLQQIDEAFAVVASYPEYRGKPIIMSEYDPDGCAACVSAAYDYRNGLVYPAYTAASFSRALDLALARSVQLEGALTWAFEYEVTALLPDETAFFDGFRVLSTQGVDKPVLNVHRMWGIMSGDRVAANSSGQVPMDEVLSSGITGNDTDVGVLATLDASLDRAFVFVWHYNDNDLSYPDADVAVRVSGLPSSFAGNGGKLTVTHYRIDDEHSNSYTAWLAMGSPQPPSAEQFDELVQAGKLQTLEDPQSAALAEDGSFQLSFTLPIRALSLIVLENNAGSC